MSRHMQHLALALALPLSAILLGLFLTSRAATSLAQTQFPSAGPPGSDCFTWNFENTTGQDVNDLHIRLQGITSVSEIYTGTLNPFGLPASSGYDPNSDVYTLNFNGYTVTAGERVALGLCADKPVLKLAQASDPPPFYWTIDGIPQEPAPLFVGLAWHWQDRQNLQLEVINNSGVTVTVNSLLLLDPGMVSPLEYLVEGFAGLQPVAAEVYTETLVLLPGASSFFDVFFEEAPPVAGMFKPFGFNTATTPLLEPYHPYMFEMQVASEVDPGETFYLGSQVLGLPIRIFHPLIRKQ